MVLDPATLATPWFYICNHAHADHLLFFVGGLYFFWKFPENKLRNAAFGMEQCACGYQGNQLTKYVYVS